MGELNFFNKRLPENFMSCLQSIFNFLPLLQHKVSSARWFQQSFLTFFQTSPFHDSTRQTLWTAFFHTSFITNFCVNDICIYNSQVLILFNVPIYDTFTHCGEKCMCAFSHASFHCTIQINQPLNSLTRRFSNCCKCYCGSYHIIENKKLG